MKKMFVALLTGATVISMSAALVCAEEADKSETIVIYTNNDSDGRDEWLINRAAEEGFHVEVVGLGASAITERMIAEKNNPLCDVVFGANNIEYEKMKASGLLQTWEPDWTDGVDQSLIDAEGYYYPVTTTPLLLIGNADYEDMPSDWTDLTDDKYAGLYQLHGLSGGTGKTVYASIISRYPDPDGELGISDEGWEIAAKFLGNAHNIAEGEDSIGEVIDGTYPMDEHWASGVLTEQKERDYKFQIMVPEIGVPYVVESVAIAEGTTKYDLCVEFLNWLGSAEIQLEWSNNFGTIPCQEEALANVSADISELMSMLTPQNLDWEFIAENVDAWVEKAELEFVQ
ncbi:extracellular solute-binding protein [Marvinbryantia formatexigens]|nr:extracellular solute-binding protein [Marvinbryantia formatexigens]UWO23255.1 extracellular solute-binding protein [Marvinbryantia formatexigens DSM 14469]SDG61210.1 iron(III) transport system substrate-binding protein [Marvinbryantia formatexigens]